MKSILRATAMLGGSSAVSILAGLVSAKVSATILGPSGVGFIGLLQGMLGLATLIATAGTGTGLIRMGANALRRGDYAEFAAHRRAAWLLLWGIGGAVAIGLVIGRETVSSWLLGSPEHGGAVVLMTIALLFSLAAGLQVSLLNAYHHVAAMAKNGVFNAVLGTGVAMAAIALWHEQGIVVSFIAGAIVSWAISYWLLRRHVPPLPDRPTRDATVAATRSLLRFGVPYTASMFVGTGVQFLLPALVLHALSTDDVGYYRAASSIAGSYLGFLLLAMGQDYYPRVAAVSDRPSEVVGLVNQQHRVVMLLAMPMILGTMALSPYLVPIVYTPQFRPAVEILEWQLIGDLFRFSSWTMGFVILSRSSGATVFLVELVAGVNLLAASWLGLHWFGLAGLGMAFLFTYVVHWGITWAIVRRTVGMEWTTENQRLAVGALAAAMIIRALPSLGLEGIRTPVALLFAIVAGAGSLYLIWQEVGGWRNVRVWR